MHLRPNTECIGARPVLNPKSFQYLKTHVDTAVDQSAVVSLYLVPYCTVLMTSPRIASTPAVLNAVEPTPSNAQSCLQTYVSCKTVRVTMSDLPVPQRPDAERTRSCVSTAFLHHPHILVP